MSAYLPVGVPDRELNRRWALVRTAMRAHGVDVLVMQGTNDWLGGYVRWFTDVPAHNGYPRTVIFPFDGEMTVVEIGARGARRLDPGSMHRGVGEIRFSPSFPSIAYTQRDDAALVCAILREGGYRRIGILGRDGMPHGLVWSIAVAIEGRGSIVDASDIIDPIKAVKSSDEVGFIRQVCALQDQVFAAVLGCMRPGLSETEVMAQAWRVGQIGGSEQGILLGGSAPVGIASRFVGRHLQGRTLERGDHLAMLIEINGPGGFYAELARTVVLGRATQELRDGFAAVREVQVANLATMKPGTPCREIATRHDAFMRARGLPVELRLYAHGQGYDMVERPLIRDDETMALAEGMCLAVHPGYETPSMFAVICDNYMIGPDGPGDCLHRTEKTIFEIH